MDNQPQEGESNFVCNYFNQSVDSVVLYFGNLQLMPQDSVNFGGNNVYRHVLENDSLNVYFKNALLFSYGYSESGIDTVTVYYPFDGSVAYRAQFRKSRLHGQVVSLDKTGKILEVMMYKRGKYKYHLYHWIHSNIGKKKLFLESAFANPVVVK